MTRFVWIVLGIAIGSAEAAELPLSLPSPSPSGAASVFGDDLVQLRDPFKRPVVKVELSKSLTELERFPVEQFTLVGVTTGPSRTQALLRAPDGKTYIASIRMKIGTKGGVIYGISTEAVFVREKMTNVIGQDENIDSVISLAPSSQSTWKLDRVQKSAGDIETKISGDSQANDPKDGLNNGEKEIGSRVPVSPTEVPQGPTADSQD